MVDVGTNLYTLQTEFGLTERASGSGSIVFTTQRWEQQAKGLSNPAGILKILNLMKRLAGVALDTPISQGWIKYPLRYTNGVVELRTEGLRAYGRVVGKVVGTDEKGARLVVFDTAEDKDFEDETDPKLTAQAAATAEEIAVRWNALTKSKPGDTQASAVVQLSERRERNRKKKG